MLRSANLTKREEQFLSWLLDPELFGERVRGRTTRDLKKIAEVLRRLRSFAPGSVESGIAGLETDQRQLKQEILSKRTVFASKIQSRSDEGTENIEQTERLFLATLIARKHGKKPYDFLFRRLDKPPFSSAKAIEMRVRRFEQRLQAFGPTSCGSIATREYSQFLVLRRQKQLLDTLTRYQARKVNYREYCSRLKHLVMPSPRESRWLRSLCAYALPIGQN